MKRKQNAKKRQCVCEACQQHSYSAIANEHRAINRLVATLDEKHRRRFVGLLALQLGRGSIQLLNTITGLDRATVVAYFRAFP